MSLTRSETVEQAIRELARVGKAFNETWRRAMMDEVVRGDLSRAYTAVADAIESLSPPRSERLRTSEVAVLFDLSEKQAHRVLQKQASKSEPSFRAFREGKIPPGFAQVALTLTTYDGHKTTKLRWVYDRKHVVPWWKSLSVNSTNTEAKLQRERLVEALKKKLDKCDEQLKRLYDQKAQIEIDLEALNIAFLHTKLAAGTRTTTAVVTERQPYLVSADGTVIDHAWLPISTAEQSALVLIEEGTVEWLTLHEAVTERVWQSEKAQSAWQAVWLGAIADSQQQADKLFTDIRVRRAAADGALPLGDRIRSRQRS
jgi:hypothetical protein